LERVVVPSFTVTAAGQKVNLDATGSAQTPFTVTNTSAQTLRGRLLTKPNAPTEPEWLSVVGESIRDFGPNAAEQVVVQLNVPPTTTPGSYAFRLDAVSEVDPDEDFTEGPSVAFEVTPPPPEPKKKRFPWWILIVVGAVVLLIIIGVVVWLLTKNDSKPATPTFAIPSVVAMQPTQAQSVLARAGFQTAVQTVAVRLVRQVGFVVSQDPTAGTLKPRGTTVIIRVGKLSGLTRTDRLETLQTRTRTLKTP
jgi:beta-lactam-binding protein with PASTA domain